MLESPNTSDVTWVKVSVWWIFVFVFVLKNASSNIWIVFVFALFGNQNIFINVLDFFANQQFKKIYILVQEIETKFIYNNVCQQNINQTYEQL